MLRVGTRVKAVTNDQITGTVVGHGFLDAKSLSNSMNSEFYPVLLVEIDNSNAFGIGQSSVQAWHPDMMQEIPW